MIFSSQTWQCVLSMFAFVNKVLNEGCQVHGQPYIQHAICSKDVDPRERDRDRQSSGPTQQQCFLAYRCCYTSWYPDPDIWSYSIVYCLVQSTITGRKRPQHRNSKKSIIFLTHPWLNGLSIDVVVTLKCLYLLAFILSFVVIPKHVIWYI